MNLLTPKIVESIERNIINNVQRGRFRLAAAHINDTIDELHASIPDDKRISYSIYFTIKSFGEHLYQALIQADLNVLEALVTIFNIGLDDMKEYSRNKGVSLHGLSLLVADKSGDLEAVLPYFERAASSDFWELREYAAGFLSVIIRACPDEMRQYLSGMADSENPNIRRWVSESLRPVRDNQWFYKDPQYSILILRKMFRESSAYPRTSVGNNLSDLARRLPELVFSIVEELMESGDSNSCWIACRACRNLVKSEPIRVMDLLKVDEYKYKKRIHRRSECQGN